LKPVKDLVHRLGSTQNKKPGPPFITLTVVTPGNPANFFFPVVFLSRSATTLQLTLFGLTLKKRSSVGFPPPGHPEFGFLHSSSISPDVTLSN
jgi:hypothetical protein